MALANLKSVDEGSRGRLQATDDLEEEKGGWKELNAERRMEKKRRRKKKMEAEDSLGNGFIGKRKQVAPELSVAIAQPSKKWKSANGSVLRIKTARQWKSDN